MMLPYSNPHPEYQEQGVILVLFGILIVSMLALAGLAIDGGNIYNARLASQSATDAAVVAGAGMIAINKTETEAELGAVDIACLNLTLKGYGCNRAKIQADYRTGNNTMWARVGADVDLYLLQAVPGFSFSSQVVDAQAQARVSPAIVAIILDTSNSMNCPKDDQLGANDEPCACHPDCEATHGAANLKIAALKEAVGDFVNHFKPGRDHISITGYGTGAEVLLPMDTTGFQRHEVDAALAKITAAAGETNTSDALFRAYWDMKTKGQEFEKYAAYVHFSDGSASGVRMFGVNMRHSGSAWVRHNILNQSWSKFDYLNWTVNIDCPEPPAIPSACSDGADNDGDSLIDHPDDPECSSPEDNSEADAGLQEPAAPEEPEGCVNGRRTAPNLLYGTPTSTQWNPRTFSGIDPRPRPSGTAKRIAWSIVDAEYPWHAWDGVFRDMVIYMPDGTKRCVGPPARWDVWRNHGRYKRRANGTVLRGCNRYNWDDWAPGEHLRIYADVALLYSDFMREEGGKFFTIGYGKEAGNELDPYQNAESILGRKDTFLMRTANDPCGMFNPQFPGYEDQRALMSPTTVGNYYPTASTEEFDLIYAAIARKIKLGLAY